MNLVQPGGVMNGIVSIFPLKLAEWLLWGNNHVREARMLLFACFKLKRQTLVLSFCW